MTTETREVWVLTNGNSPLPREMAEYTVESISLTHWEFSAGGGAYTIEVPVEIPLCEKGYPEVVEFGDSVFEFLYHARARHLYLTITEPDLQGSACFLVRFRKGA